MEIGERKLVKQINQSPELLKNYIHELEASVGNVALIIRELFVLKENVQGLTRMLKRGTPIK